MNSEHIKKPLRDWQLIALLAVPYVAAVFLFFWLVFYMTTLAP
jgi:hypothetical protein